MVDERLIVHLSHRALEKYVQIAPHELRVQFEQLLDSILRWGSSIPHDAKFKQTVLDHVEECIKWVFEAKKEFCALASEIDLDEVVGMLLIHDIGEAFGGDMDKNGERYDDIDGKQKKTIQRRGALMVAIGNIPNPACREYVRTLYSRFEGVSGKNEDEILKAITSCDKAALFARLIDLMEGNLTASVHFFSPNRLPKEKVTEELIDDRLGKMLGETMFIYFRLRGLLTPDAQPDLDFWWNQQIAAYKDQGYPEDKLARALK